MNKKQFLFEAFSIMILAELTFILHFIGGFGRATYVAAGFLILAGILFAVLQLLGKWYRPQSRLPRSVSVANILLLLVLLHFSATYPLLRYIILIYVPAFIILLAALDYRHNFPK